MVKQGTARDPKYVPVHELKLDVAMRSTLPAFHAVTGSKLVFRHWQSDCLESVYGKQPTAGQFRLW